LACTHGYAEFSSPSTKSRFHCITRYAENFAGFVNRALTYVAEQYSRPQWNGEARDIPHKGTDRFSRRARLFGIGSRGRKMLKPFALFLRIGLFQGDCGSALPSADNSESFVNEDSYRPIAERALTLYLGKIAEGQQQAALHCILSFFVVAEQSESLAVKQPAIPCKQNVQGVLVSL